nr:glycosyl hydrolase family 8 [Candidatus Eremiobacteraeota bacterium]
MANGTLTSPRTSTSAQPGTPSRLARLRGIARISVPEPVIVAALMAVALVAQGLNMFHYPAFTFTDDEGIYLSQAWAALREGRLSPYTYVYDHAPAGWLQIAAWMGLTGGPHTFGSPVNSGRILMLLLHLAMVPILYQLARKLRVGAPLAALAVALFSLSPLALFYQRLVLIDTVMLFWALLSINLLLDGWGRLSRVVVSGACFGIAILSKETALFLLPALGFIALKQRRRHQGQFGVGSWLLAMAVVISFYPLFAWLKGELLPTGQAASFSAVNGYANASVSLLDSVWWQLRRSGGGMFNVHNQFWTLVGLDWLPRDPILFIGGAAASVLNLARGVGWRRIRNRQAFVTGLLGVLPLLYLARGGLVLNYAVLFAIPFFCLNIAVLLQPLADRLPAPTVGICALVIPLALLAGYWHAGTLKPLYTQQPDAPGHDAVAWIKQNVPTDSLIITRDDLWTDLHEPGDGSPSFPGAHSHWKVAADPAIRRDVFHDDWRTVDYLVMSPGLEQDFTASNDTVALAALQHAHPVKQWFADAGPADLHTQQTITLWKVDKPGSTDVRLLRASATGLTNRFARDGAYVAADGTVTSESQSYAMLRAVWSDDRPTFDRTWGWTNTHLTRPDALFAWQWRAGAVRDANSAADADTDIALALLLGGKRWNDPALIAAGTRVAGAIWTNEVATIGGVPHITAGNWAPNAPVVALNPSYFSPYAYRIFREVDPGHNWQGVIDSGYQTLFAVSRDPLGVRQSSGLPPDWVGMNRETGALVALPFPASDTTRYG